MKEHASKTLESLGRLKQLRGELPQLGSRIMLAGKKNMYPMDWVVIGIVKRCLSISSALESLILSWNLTCARALLRMQLDTMIRFSAFWLSDDPNQMAREVMDGKQINKMKDQDGKVMTDAYLTRKLGEDFVWVPRVYNYTSGYIHFSERHLFDPIWNTNDEERIVKFVINEYDHKFPESSWTDLVDCASECLVIIKVWLEDYLKEKTNNV